MLIDASTLKHSSKEKSHLSIILLISLLHPPVRENRTVHRTSTQIPLHRLWLGFKDTSRILKVSLRCIESKKVFGQGMGQWYQENGQS
ncbi:hypothetical protein PoB_003774400 [Plakobranchus ocellatus]|uniref:Uncharacterized protein n=1 Tax=Plakobranchus ocellatus TaxID=259542 RepID=A0AAV4ATW1_9GAST|nr:hypothetical protein PoB_003774400 [Plakobranchus ocellatus]